MAHEFYSFDLRNALHRAGKCRPFNDEVLFEVENGTAWLTSCGEIGAIRSRFEATGEGIYRFERGKLLSWLGKTEGELQLSESTGKGKKQLVVSGGGGTARFPLSPYAVADYPQIPPVSAETLPVRPLAIESARDLLGIIEKSTVWSQFRPPAVEILIGESPVAWTTDTRWICRIGAGPGTPVLISRDGLPLLSELAGDVTVQIGEEGSGSFWVSDLVHVYLRHPERVLPSAEAVEGALSNARSGAVAGSIDLAPTLALEVAESLARMASVAGDGAMFQVSIAIDPDFLIVASDSDTFAGEQVFEIPGLGERLGMHMALYRCTRPLSLIRALRVAAERGDGETVALSLGSEMAAGTRSLIIQSGEFIAVGAPYLPQRGENP